MTTERASGTTEANVFSLIWNRRLLVAAFALAFAGIGLLVGELRQKEYTAQASVLLSQPAPTSDNPNRDEARYVADQVAVMKSLDVAQAASVIARRDSEHPITIDARSLQRRTLVSASDESNFVSVSFQAGSPAAAVTGANSTVRAYEQAIGTEIKQRAQDAIHQLDEAIETAEAEAASTSDQDASDAADLVTRLKAERDRTETSAAVAGDGVTEVYEAEAAKAGGPSTFAILAFSLVLGALVGSGVAYWKGTRSQEFFEALDPQALLGIPLLVEIPNFGRGELRSMLPALASSASPAAREFRLLAASLTVNAESNGQPKSRANKVRQPPYVAFVSPTKGDGSTTVAANTALAAAQQGQRVEALDADIERQGMKTLLEVATARPSEAAGEVSNDADAELWKLWHEADEEVNGHGEDRAPRIQQLVAPPVIRIGDRGRVTVIDLGPAASTSMHRRTKGEFDLVIADGPPMLDGDHINEIVRSAGAVVIVVRHRGKAEDARQLIGRLELLGVRPLGYVYNRGGSSRKHWTTRRSARRGADVPDQGEQRRPVDPTVEEDLVERR